MKELSEELIIKHSKRKSIIDKITGFFFLFVALICACIIVFTIVFIIVKGISAFTNTYIDSNGNPYKQSFWGFISGMSYTATNYGALFLLINTIYIVFLSSIISIPVSILTAIFIVRIAPKSIGAIFQTGIEMLASIPSVIFGLFGMGVICPFVNDIATSFGLQTSGGLSVLSGAIVLALMSIPTITLITITSIKSVSNSYIQGSLALGATNSETNFRVVLKGAISGIISGIILGLGRALGEATAVSLVIGNSFAGPNFNPFGIGSTLTSTMMQGIGESVGLNYDIRFSLGILLMFVIVLVNLILNYVKNKITNPYKKSGVLLTFCKNGVIYIKSYFNKSKDNKDGILDKDKEENNISEIENKEDQKDENR